MYAYRRETQFQVYHHHRQSVEGNSGERVNEKEKNRTYSCASLTWVRLLRLEMFLLHFILRGGVARGGRKRWSGKATAASCRQRLMSLLSRQILPRIWRRLCPPTCWHCPILYNRGSNDDVCYSLWDFSNVHLFIFVGRASTLFSVVFNKTREEKNRGRIHPLTNI